MRRRSVRGRDRTSMSMPAPSTTSRRRGRSALAVTPWSTVTVRPSRRRGRRVCHGSASVVFRIPVPPCSRSEARPSPPRTLLEADPLLRVRVGRTERELGRGCQALRIARNFVAPRRGVDLVQSTSRSGGGRGLVRDSRRSLLLLLSQSVCRVRSAVGRAGRPASRQRVESRNGRPRHRCYLLANRRAKLELVNLIERHRAAHDTKSHKGGRRQSRCPCKTV